MTVAHLWTGERDVPSNQRFGNEGTEFKRFRPNLVRKWVYSFFSFSPWPANYNYFILPYWQNISVALSVTSIHHHEFAPFSTSRVIMIPPAGATTHFIYNVLAPSGIVVRKTPRGIKRQFLFQALTPNKFHNSTQVAGSSECRGALKLGHFCQPSDVDVAAGMQGTGRPTKAGIP